MIRGAVLSIAIVGILTRPKSESLYTSAVFQKTCVNAVGTLVGDFIQQPLQALGNSSSGYSIKQLNLVICNIATLTLNNKAYIFLGCFNSWFLFPIYFDIKKIKA